MKGFRLIKKIAQNKQGRIGLIILLELAVTPYLHRSLRRLTV